MTLIAVSPSSFEALIAFSPTIVPPLTFKVPPVTSMPFLAPLILEPAFTVTEAVAPLCLIAVPSVDLTVPEIFKFPPPLTSTAVPCFASRTTPLPTSKDEVLPVAVLSISKKLVSLDPVNLASFCSVFDKSNVAPEEITILL